MCRVIVSSSPAVKPKLPSPTIACAFGHARRTDELGPLVQLAGQEFPGFLGRADDDLDTLGGQALADVIGGQVPYDLLIEALDDLARHVGWSDYRISAIYLAMVSVPPPGALGMISRIGLTG